MLSQSPKEWKLPTNGGDGTDALQLPANGHMTKICKTDSAVSLHTGQVAIIGTCLVRRRSLVGRQLFTALHKFFLTLGGIFKFHNFRQKPELSS